MIPRKSSCPGRPASSAARPAHVSKLAFMLTGAIILAASALPAAAQTSPVARVYVQTDQGIYFYNAAADGALTLVSGSPFKTPGTWMEAARTSFFFSFDNNLIHSVAFQSSGAPGNQVDEIDSRKYTGADCAGNPDMTGIEKGVLDHTGSTLTVLLLGYAQNYSGGVSAVCQAYQSYHVSNSGQISFVGAWVTSSGCCGDSQKLNYSGNDNYAYTVNSTPAIVFFARESSGALNHFNGTAPAPPAPPLEGTSSGEVVKWVWQPQLVDADPSTHAAVMGIFQGENSNGTIIASTGRKFASYTISSSGDLTTTNTYKELPAPTVIPDVLSFNPSGNYLAVGGSPSGSSGALQVFNFSGSSPLTPYHGTFGGTSNVEVIHWDKNNHLYAADDSNHLYVYTVTSSGIVQAPGSPYKFTGALTGSGLIVIP